MRTLDNGSSLRGPHLTVRIAAKRDVLEPEGSLFNQPPAGHGQAGRDENYQQGIGEIPPPIEAPQSEKLCHGEGIDVQAIGIVVPCSDTLERKVDPEPKHRIDKEDGSAAR